MALNYEDVAGVTKEEFDSQTKFPSGTPRKATATELRQVETLLEVQPDTLSKLDFYMESLRCQSCGNEIGIYDFVHTAINDAGHSKSFILHTFVGTKHIINEPRHVQCSRCEEMSLNPMGYWCSIYGCGPGPAPA